MKKNILILFIFFTTSFFGQISSDSIYPIDRTCKKCIEDNAREDHKIVNCLMTAYQAWNEELTKYYWLLGDLTSDPKYSDLTPKRRLRRYLAQAQEIWLEYAQHEISMANAIYCGDPDIQDRGLCIENKKRAIEIYRHRALELKQYYIDLTGK